MVGWWDGDGGGVGGGGGSGGESSDNHGGGGGGTGGGGWWWWMVAMVAAAVVTSVATNLQHRLLGLSHPTLTPSSFDRAMNQRGSCHHSYYLNYHTSLTEQGGRRGDG